MSTLPATVPVVKVEPEVLPHVRAKGVEARYRHLLELTPRLFPMLRSLHVRIEPDPEIPDYTFIVFELRVPLADVPDYADAVHRWDKEFAAGPPLPRHEPFALCLYQEEE